MSMTSFRLEPCQTIGFGRDTRAKSQVGGRAITFLRLLLLARVRVARRPGAEGHFRRVPEHVRRVPDHFRLLLRGRVFGPGAE